jgi:hypothetical protein
MVPVRGSSVILRRGPEMGAAADRASDTATGFRQLYERYWLEFESYVRSRPDLSPPLLVNPPANYLSQRTKLLIVGQETRGWYDDILAGATGTCVIDVLMNIYKHRFRLGVGKGLRSAFWDFVRELETGLAIAPGAVVWSNVNKVDQKGRRPSRKIRRDIRRLFPVLSGEVDLAKPDLVVFLTGRGYDQYLQSCFPGSTFREVDGYGSLLATLSGPDLPFRAFRTYHPRYLRRRGYWPKVMEYLREQRSTEESRTH